MKLIFVHGWSVTNTDTYGEVPQALEERAVRDGVALSIQHVYLGKYVSFNDTITMSDIVRALDTALRDVLSTGNGFESFSCITHSTGGPVIREWLTHFYAADNYKNAPLKHLIMLAPANHGSPIAKLGKSRVGKIRALALGVEPGQKVLDWLALGSEYQRRLNSAHATVDFSTEGIYNFVLAGQSIDEKFYDFLNTYLKEKGSDGVVRVSGANLNYQLLRLEQNAVAGSSAFKLEKTALETAAEVPLAVFNYYSHSGKDKGIMNSVRGKHRADAPIVEKIIECLKVSDTASYRKTIADFKMFSEKQQEQTAKYSQIVVRVMDDYGTELHAGDFDFLFLAGKQFKPENLPSGFVLDKQANELTGRLIFYINADLLSKMLDGHLGLRVIARPEDGLMYYQASDFCPTHGDLLNAIRPNQTLYIDVVLKRLIDKNVFRFGIASGKPENFKKTKPSGNPAR
jgi:hypothetical protein